MTKKYIVITGGAGFVGSNLIKFLLNKTNYNLISIDNILCSIIYKIKKIKYKGSTSNINKILKP